MNYKKTTIAAFAFAAGYIIKSILAPSTPQELLSALEKKMMESPMKYEQVIDDSVELSHRWKSAANNHPTQEGYVPFSNLRLVLREQSEGDVAVLVNQITMEELPVQYIYGRTTAGSYKDRLVSVLDESHKKCAESVEKYMPKDPITEKLRNTKGHIIEKTRGMYNHIKGWFTR